jgi:curli production assembly/transport component CsgE
MTTSRLVLWAVRSSATLRPSWGIGLGAFSCLLLLAGPAAAQGERRIPARENQQERGQRQQAPVRESKSAPLPAKKLEEALRLLLQATSDSAAVPRQQRTTEIEGLIVDQTITKLGHDFYDLFYTRWEAPPKITEFTITLEERPGRGTNTLISMVVNDIPLMEMPLQPKYELLEEGVNEALNIAAGFLIESQNTSRQLEREDRGKVGSY